MAPIPRGTLKPSQLIKIKGVINPTVDERIQINIQEEKSLETVQNINLQLAVDFDQGIIIRNHYRGNQWGAQESDVNLPLALGQPFEIRILTTDNHFEIFINGKHFANFNYRLPLQLAKFVYISGELTINSVTVDGRQLSLCMHTPFNYIRFPIQLQIF